MLIKCIKNQLKCKVAKFIRVPLISYMMKEKTSACLTEYNTVVIDPIHIFNFRLSEYRTLFYVNKDSINYYYYTTRDLRRFEKVTPIYDYKSRKYHIIKHKFISDDKADKYTENLGDGYLHYDKIVTAPNGHLYLIFGVYLNNMLHSDYISLKNPDLVYIYNHTRRKVIYKERRYVTPPIGNAFIVAYDRRETNIYVDVINLVDNNVDSFKYDLNEYFKYLITSKYVNDKSLVECLREYYEKQEYYIYYKGSDEVLSWHEGDTIFIERYRVYLRPSLNCKHKVIYNVEETLLLSMDFKHDTLYFKIVSCDNMLTDEGTVLVYKEYKIQSNFDLSKSHYYAIRRIGKNYMIKERNIKYRVRDRVVLMLDQESGKYRAFDFEPISYDNLILLRIGGSIVTNAELLHFKKGEHRLICKINAQHVYPVERECSENKKENRITLLDVSKMINRIRDMNDGKYSFTGSHISDNEFIDVSEFIKSIDIEAIVSDFICKLYKKEYNDVSLYFYTYYLDEYKGDLYIFIRNKHGEDQNYNGEEKLVISKESLLILKYNLSRRQYQIVAKTKPYLYSYNGFHTRYVDYEYLSEALSMVTFNRLTKKFLALILFSHITINTTHQAVYVYSSFLYESELLCCFFYAKIHIWDIRYNRSMAFKNCWGGEDDTTSEKEYVDEYLDINLSHYFYGRCLIWYDSNQYCEPGSDDYVSDLSIRNILGVMIFSEMELVKALS